MGRVMDRGHFILGNEVEAFEAAFATYLDARYVIGVSSGLDALRLALTGLDLGPGDEVIVPANTFIATALAVSAVGATPVLVDMDDRSYNINVDLVERAISSRTRAIIPVHLYGQPCAMGPLFDVAGRYGLRVVEDACQAHGARYGGRCCGTLGDIGCFSFYPAKNLGAFGDGGAVVTNDAVLAARVRRLRNYGERAKYVHVERGINARLDALQAAILTVKLQHLESWNQHRRRLAALYSERLAKCSSIVVPHTIDDVVHVYHLYVIRCRERDRLRDYLAAAGIATGIHYPIPIHRQDCYSELRSLADSLGATDQAAGEILSLPIYAGMPEEVIEIVGEAIDRFYAADSPAVR
jgi:dTDP-3-amino-3,4,6-trideoxy-alpha-D-glucose transaminase